MAEHTTLSVRPDVAERVREFRERGHEDTSAALQALLDDTDA